MRSPTVSVVVPAYNAEPYLDAVLASVAAQSRPADEVIVVDDASSDATADVARRWSTMLPLELIEREENRGLGAARRLAIQHSSGELIAPLDADDYWVPDHLAVLVAEWERVGGMIAPDQLSWVPGQRLTTSSWGERAIPPPEQQAHAIIAGNFGSYASLFSRADYERAGGFRELRRSEDWDLWIRMVLAGTRVTLAPTPTLVYRIRPDSLSAADGCIDADVAILEELVGTLQGEEREIANRSLLWHRARRELIAGFDDVAAGRISTARRRWLRAITLNLRPTSRKPGRVALRAAACAVAPRRALRQRQAQLEDLDHLTAL